jgi:methionyl-tRNA formyltransferase
LQQELAIAEEDASETLAPKLAAIGAELMVETLRRLQSGAMTACRQDHALASLAPILKKEDGRIDFRQTAQVIYNRLRGFQPWPGAFTLFRGKILNIAAARPGSEQVPEAQLLAKGAQLFVGCGRNTSLEILELQPEGKKRMPARDFIQGYRPQTGESVGE